MIQSENKIIGGGLLELPVDKRDFNYPKVFGAIKKTTDEDFIIGKTEILDQDNSDYCTGFSTCSASAIQEGKILNPFWSFAVSKMISGDLDAYGQDLRTALKVHTKYGAIEDMVDKGRSINEYPSDLFDKAIEHKKQSYFSVFGIDLFNEIRSALWTHKSACITGAVWKNDWSNAKDGIITEEIGDEMGGHAFIFIGQKKINDKIYLVAQLSNGIEFGDKGLFYFPKEVINRDCRFGTFCFIDMPVEEARKKSWSLIRQFWEQIKLLLKSF